MKGKRILLIFIPILIICIYCGIIYMNKDKMIGNMVINGVNCSFKDYEEIVSLLESNVTIPEIAIMNDDTQLSTLNVGEYCTFTYDTDSIKQINEKISYLQRLFFFIYQYEHTIEPNISINDEAINQVMVDSNGTEQPENAYIFFNKETGLYEIAPEKLGNIIETETASEIITQAIMKNESSVNISAAYIKANILSDNEELIEQLDKLNNQFNFTIIYEMPTEEKVVLNSSIYHEWFEQNENGIPYINEDGNFILNEQIVRTYVENLALQYDTLGKEITFTTTNGKDIVFTEGSYGYKLDVEKEISQLYEDIMTKDDIIREPIWSQTALTYNTIGQTYVEVSKDEQHMWYYKDGEVILESDVVTGTLNKNDTNTGIWYVMSKRQGTYLTGPTWKSWVDYWMPFNSDGEGLHDASWRNGKFGGTIYRSNGSHGCVNLPMSVAEELFELIEVGTPVIVY